MAGNWWFDNQGRNNLAGVPGDSTNPPILTDAVIIDLLINHPNAKRDFKVLLPTMLHSEQARLTALVESHPLTLQPFPFNEGAVEDAFQASQNKVGIHDPNNRRRRR